MAKELTNPIQFDYDTSTDVLSATFGTGEPSYSEEVDDFLIIDFGIYSGAPTGFQILHIKEVGVAQVHVVLQKVLKETKSHQEETQELLMSDRNARFRQAIQSVQTKAR